MKYAEAMAMLEKVKNYPDEARWYDCIIAKKDDNGELWFYGAYDYENITEVCEIAKKIDGLVLDNGHLGDH